MPRLRWSVEVGADGCAASRGNGGAPSRDWPATDRDTPPEDSLLGQGQVSWLAGRRLCLSGLPGDGAPVALIDRRLAAYSCGGSSGLVAVATHRIPSSLRTVKLRRTLDRWY